MLNHGINTLEQATGVATPAVAASGIPFIVGASPIWHGSQAANRPALVYSWAEAVEKFGYSDDWASYPLCEAFYTYFRKYAVGPLLCVCPLDPQSMCTAQAAADVAVANRKAKLPIAAIPGSIVVKSPATALAESTCAITAGAATVSGLNLTTTGVIVKTAGGETCTLTTDYTLALEGDQLTVTVVAGGQLAAATACKVSVPRASTAITYTLDTDYELYVDGDNVVVAPLPDGPLYGLYVTSLSVAYNKATPDSLTADDIIGGYDTTSHTNTGLECVEECMGTFGFVPDNLQCPGWSEQSAVAAAMAAKAGAINGMFKALALVDLDCTSSGATAYDGCVAAKAAANLTDPNQVVCWPRGKLGSRTFRLSVELGALMAKVDTANGGCPVESPSNKKLQLDGIVNGAGDELRVTISQADYLNDNGIVTVLGFMGGLQAWGNKTGCYPASTDPKDYFIPTSRMFGWIARTVVFTFWSRIDRPMTPVLIQSIQNSANDWLAGLVGAARLLGARVEFVEGENPVTSLMAGRCTFHVYITPPAPMERADFVFEYDSSYLSALFE